MLQRRKGDTGDDPARLSFSHELYGAGSADATAHSSSLVQVHKYPILALQLVDRYFPTQSALALGHRWLLAGLTNE